MGGIIKAKIVCYFAKNSNSSGVEVVLCLNYKPEIRVLFKLCEEICCLFSGVRISLLQINLDCEYLSAVFS